MQLILTEAEALVRDSARKLSQELLAPNAGRWDKEERFPKEAMAQLGTLGFLSMLVPEEDGGSGAGAFAYALAMMELARGCASTAVTMGVTNMVADAISRFGTASQKTRYLPHFGDGSYSCAAFSLSEPGAGSDAQNLKTVARKDGDTWVIRGEKAWVTSATEAPLFLVMAKTEAADGRQKATAFLIERGTKGLSVTKKEEKMGLRASPTAGLVLDHVRVSDAQRLAPLGDGLKVALTALDGGRIGVGAQAVGIGRAALEAALRYSQERVAFGKPIADFQAIQWKLADMATELDAAELLVWRAASLRARKVPCTREAAMAKLFAADAGYRAAKEAVQILGGYGYVAEYPVERHFRDVRVTQIYEGANEIQRLVIARDVLK
jgi:alkylation response protein AidB-like acyl-CoA dehydrogenase